MADIGNAGKVVDFRRMTKNPNPGFFIFLFCEGWRGGQWGGGGRGLGSGMADIGNAGKVVDFRRMTKNPNPGFFIFLFCEGWRGGQWGGGGGAGQMLKGEWKQLFSDVTHCINLINFAFNFHQDCPKATYSWLAQKQPWKFIKGMLH